MFPVLSSILGSRFSVISFWWPISGSSRTGLFPPILVIGWFRVIFFVEGETDSTSERARGQFSIFGAVEENDGSGASRIGTQGESS
jgi:hypothetical protein